MVLRVTVSTGCFEVRRGNPDQSNLVADHPRDQPAIHRFSPSSVQGAGGCRRFDPRLGLRVPLIGQPESTGAACPRGPYRLVAARCRPTRPAAPDRSCFQAAGQTLPVICTLRGHREQAHVPAEQPPPAQGPRLPPSYADPRGSLDSGEPSPKGPSEPVRLRTDSCPPSAFRGADRAHRRFPAH